MLALSCLVAEKQEANVLDATEVARRPTFGFSATIIRELTILWGHGHPRPHLDAFLFDVVHDSWRQSMLNRFVTVPITTMCHIQASACRRRSTNERESVCMCVCVCVQVSYTFCCDFISLLMKSAGSSDEFGPTEVVVQGLKKVSSNTDIYHQFQSVEMNHFVSLAYMLIKRHKLHFSFLKYFCYSLDLKLHISTTLKL